MTRGKPNDQRPMTNDSAKKNEFVSAPFAAGSGVRSLVLAGPGWDLVIPWASGIDHMPRVIPPVADSLVFELPAKAWAGILSAMKTPRSRSRVFALAILPALALPADF